MASTRITGIMSGFDTESLVKAQVSHLQMQIDRMSQNTQRLTWKRERYTEVYKKIEEFRNKVYDYKLSNKTSLKTAASSNESALTVKANADAPAGTHTITVKKLATGAQTGSQTVMGSSSNKASIESQFVDGSGNAVYNSTIDITINGKSVSVDPTQSLNELVKKINNSGAGVTASYDANSDRFFITSNETGAAAKIDFTGTTGVGEAFLKDALKMPVDSVTGDLAVIKGQDAEFDLDGITGLTQSTNEFTISGITYSLKEADPSKTLTVTVKNDTEGIYNSVKEFVEMYNTLLEALNSTVLEQKQSSYEPLTDAQKEAMTSDQIDKWEENAKKGILRNDSILQSIVSNLRTTIYSSVKGLGTKYDTSVSSTLGVNSTVVGGKYDSLFSLGLKTADYSTNGKLEIDEDKLKAAIEDDPDAVYKIFTGGVDSQGNATDGVADKLYDQLKTALDRINTEAGSAVGDKDQTSTLSKKIISNNKAMNAKIDRMNAQMETYYKQYANMEELLQQLQSQQDTLTNYLGSSS
ncbi:MAG: flagellar filament capping protein FliD [Acidaminococcales bacterium]|jgi:flagellar hook-associated protein 2|nr:flagellar filament capping protein FliD [Acidaminococcales bacterium]